MMNKPLCIFMSLIVASTVRAQSVNNDANALMLATQAKSLVGHAVRGSSGFDEQKERLRSQRGLQVGTQTKEAGCGGLSIGNVRPVLGDHRSHETTVIIRGSVINSGNKC